MRKSTLTAIISLLLVCVFILSSCASCTGGGAVAYKSLINKKTAASDFENYSSISQVSALTGATVVAMSNDLIYLTGSKEDGMFSYEYPCHIVYNLKTDTVVYTKTESDQSDITVELYGTNNSIRFSIFAIKTETRETAEDGSVSTKHSTTLYDDAGNEITSADKILSPQVFEDLIYFNEKFYRADSEGKIKAAFNFSALAKLPSITDRSKKYYYSVRTHSTVSSYVEVYSDKLEFVSRYSIPSHAQISGYAILENGNILLQYVYEEDEQSDDYTMIFTDSDDNQKYTVRTLIIDAKSGKEKEIECEYVFLSNFRNYSLYSDEDLPNGVNLRSNPVIGWGAKIEDRRVSMTNGVTLYANNSGKISPLDTYKGAKVSGIENISSDRWVLFTENDRKYLVRDNGKIVGEITNAQQSFEDFFVFNETVYNDSLEPVFDYKKKELSIRYTLDAAILFTNKDGELLLYTGGTSATTLISGDDKRELVDLSLTGGFFTIRDDSSSYPTFEIYNGAGSKVGTVPSDVKLSSTSYFSSVCSIDGVLLITATDVNGENVYFRLSVSK